MIRCTRVEIGLTLVIYALLKFPQCDDLTLVLYGLENSFLLYADYTHGDVSRVSKGYLVEDIFISPDWKYPMTLKYDAHLQPLIAPKSNTNVHTVIHIGLQT